MQSVGSSLQSVTSFLISWFLSYCRGLKCVLLSQCCSCNDCEGQEKAQGSQCQESKWLHFHCCSTSPAPHDAATQVGTSLSPNSIMFSGRKGKKKQFLDSPATFNTFVALQMMKPGSVIVAASIWSVQAYEISLFTVCVLFVLNTDFSVLWDRPLF